MSRRRRRAEPADVVIMTDVAIDQSSAQGAVVAGSRADIARTGMGVGVREGAAGRTSPRPRRSSSRCWPPRSPTPASRAFLTSPALKPKFAAAGLDYKE